MLYDDRPRSPKPRHRQAGESLFNFYDRLDHPQASTLRQTTNEWLEHIPSQFRPEFLARLRARDNDHVSALFELFLFNRLQHGGFRVSFTSPRSDGSRPDLELTCGHFRCMIEAAVRMPADTKIEDDLRLSRLLGDAARHIHDKSLRVWVLRRRQSSRTPSARRFANWVDENAAFAAPSDQPGRPRPLTYTDADAEWQLRLTIVRLNNPDRVPESIKAGEMGGVYRPESIPMLTRTLRQKRRQHKGIDLPVVPAIGWYEFKHEPESDDIATVLSRHWQPDENNSMDGVTRALIWCGRCIPPAVAEWQCTLWVPAGHATPLEEAWPWKTIRLDTSSATILEG